MVSADSQWHREWKIENLITNLRQSEKEWKYESEIECERHDFQFNYTVDDFWACFQRQKTYQIVYFQVPFISKSSVIVVDEYWEFYIFFLFYHYFGNFGKKLLKRQPAQIQTMKTMLLFRIVHINGPIWNWKRLKSKVIRFCGVQVKFLCCYINIHVHISFHHVSIIPVFAVCPLHPLSPLFTQNR